MGRIKLVVSEEDVRKAYQRSMDSMARLNRIGARLMHKYNAHGATDVTGFGLLGHAQALARNQKNEVSFVIHNLPVIAKMAAVAKACGNMFQLLQGHSAKTSKSKKATRHGLLELSRRDSTLRVSLTNLELSRFLPRKRKVNFGKPEEWILKKNKPGNGS